MLALRCMSNSFGLEFQRFDYLLEKAKIPYDTHGLNGGSSTHLPVKPQSCTSCDALHPDQSRSSLSLPCSSGTFLSLSPKEILRCQTQTLMSSPCSYRQVDCLQRRVGLRLHTRRWRSWHRARARTYAVPTPLPRQGSRLGDGSIPVSLPQPLSSQSKTRSAVIECPPFVRRGLLTRLVPMVSEHQYCPGLLGEYSVAPVEVGRHTATATSRALQAGRLRKPLRATHGRFRGVITLWKPLSRQASTGILPPSFGSR
jgi:hypothetical protein